MKKFGFSFGLLFAISLSASPFKPSTYKYLKTIETKSEPGIYSLKIDEDVFINSNYADLRIVNSENQLVPYIRRSIEKQRSENSLSFKQIYKKRTENSLVLVVFVEEIPKDQKITSLQINGGDTFESSVSIQTSNNSQDWGSSFSASVSNYDSSKESAILNIPNSRSSYYRLEFFSTADFSVKKVLSRENETQEKLIFSVPEFETEKTEWDNGILYKPKLENIAFNRVYLKFKEPSFRRRIEINAFDPITKKFKILVDSFVSKEENDEDVLTIGLPEVASKKWKFTIYNDDNKPLELESIQVGLTSEEILFEKKEGETLKLYYGNAFANLPLFDELFLDSIRKVESREALKAKLLQQQENPEFGYSLFEPPLSGKILTGMFYASLAIIFLLCWRLYRKEKKLGI